MRVNLGGRIGLALCMGLLGCRSSSLPAVGGDAFSPAPDLAARADLAAPSSSLRVLFIGNSYTYVNDLPGRVHELAASSAGGPEIVVESVAPGGATLQQHYTATGALPRVRAGGFSHVVLQGQSVEPLTAPTLFQTYAELFVEDIRAAGAVPVFFETWARRAGDPLYQQAWSGGSPKAMQAGIRTAYRLAAQAGEKGGSALAPAGDAWEMALAEALPPPLFVADGSHPTPHGTYLTGCVIYRALTGRSALGLGARPAELDAGEAALLQRIADQTAP